MMELILKDNLLSAGNARWLGIYSACQSESRNFQPSVVFLKMFIVNMHMVLCLMCCHLSVHDTRIYRSNIIASAISL